MRGDKARVTVVETKLLALIDPSLLAASEAQNHLILLRDDFCEIDANIGCVDGPARAIPRIVSDLRAMNHGIRRRAAAVDAGSAQVLSLDERDGPSQIRDAKRQRATASTRA